MPEASPVTSPVTEACAAPVREHQELMLPYIEAFARAEKYETSKAHYPHWRQCCPELQSKIDSLRPFDTDLEDLKSIPNEMRMFADRKDCSAQYFSAPEGGGDSPFAVWFTGQLESNRAHWQQQYGDLDHELLSCCVMKFGECLYQETGVRSCTAKLTLEERPPAASAAAATLPSDQTSAATGAPALPVPRQAEETTAGSVLLIILIAIVLLVGGLVFGSFLSYLLERIFGDRYSKVFDKVFDRLENLFEWLDKVVTAPFRRYGQWRRSSRKVSPSADRKA